MPKRFPIAKEESGCGQWKTKSDCLNPRKLGFRRHTRCVDNETESVRGRYEGQIIADMIQSISSSTDISEQYRR